MKIEEVIGGAICGACVFLLLHLGAPIWTAVVGVMVPYVSGLVLGMRSTDGHKKKAQP